MKKFHIGQTVFMLWKEKTGDMIKGVVKGEIKEMRTFIDEEDYYVGITTEEGHYHTAPSEQVSVNPQDLRKYVNTYWDDKIAQLKQFKAESLRTLTNHLDQIDVEV